jgi:hypothetical protein
MGEIFFLETTSAPVQTGPRRIHFRAHDQFRLSPETNYWLEHQRSP